MQPSQHRCFHYHCHEIFHYHSPRPAFLLLEIVVYPLLFVAEHEVAVMEFVNALTLLRYWASGTMGLVHSSQHSFPSSSLA